MQPNSLTSLSPSFNSYSSGQLAEIAARVVHELADDSEHDSFFPHTAENSDPNTKKSPIPGDDDDDEEEEEFEFAIVRREPEAPASSADEIFYNGQIRPVYPLFNTDLLLDNDELSRSAVSSQNRTAKPARLPLGKLFSEDRETTSCSSSEADDTENIPADSYCVWKPKKAAAAEEGEISGRRCKKSSSTGTNSKRWKIRDLLYRSNSDGKDRYVFLSPAAKGEREKEQKGMVEKHYVKSRAGKESEKRRSLLPYRPDLLGLFLP